MPSRRGEKNFRKCVVCGIKAFRENNKKRLFMARFPLDEDRCRKWLQVIGIEDLAYIPVERLQQRYVCKNHFRQKDFNKKTSRLKKKAIPSIGLNGKPLSDDILQDFPCRVHREHQLPNKGRTVIETKEEQQRGKQCVKCGASPARDPDTVLFKFPKPGIVNDQQTELWAKFAYPNQPWSNKDFQLKLFYEEKMLCHRHFKETWFVNNKSSKILRRPAFPDVDEDTELYPENDDVGSFGSPSPQPFSDIIVDQTSDVPEPSGLDFVIPSTTESRVKNNIDIEANISVFNIEGNSNTNLDVPEHFGMDIEVPPTSGSNYRIASTVSGSSKTSLKVPVVSNCVVLEASNTKVFVIDASLMPSNSSKTRRIVPTAFVKNCKVPEICINRNVVPVTRNCEVPRTYINTSSNTLNIPTAVVKNYAVPGPYINTNNLYRPKFKDSGTSETIFNSSEASNCKKHIKIIRNLKRKIKCLENKACFAKLTTDDAIKKLVTHMNVAFRKGSLNRRGNKKVNIKTQRWSEDDKIRALRLYRKSPSYYRLMRQMFDLPSLDVVLDFILKRRSRIKTK